VLLAVSAQLLMLLASPGSSHPVITISTVYQYEVWLNVSQMNSWGGAGCKRAWQLTLKISVLLLRKV
jgi:hypothetical protein